MYYKIITYIYRKIERIYLRAYYKNEKVKMQGYENTHFAWYSEHVYLNWLYRNRNNKDYQKYLELKKTWGIHEP